MNLALRSTARSAAADSPVATGKGLVVIRQARPDEAPLVHALILANLEAGHLLPRTLADVTAHAGRFLVADHQGAVVACGELAPLSREVAEVRSLVVDEGRRARGIGHAIVAGLRERAERDGFETLCVFAHEPAYFARMGFSMVPHSWLPEKIAVDCCTCPLFRKCGQVGLLVRLDPRGSVTSRAERLVPVPRPQATW